MNIRNPILPGFNPDPSIVRVGDDYYVATSTFEWFPGVQIHHSRDLVHWRLLTRPLTRPSQLNMLGDPDSCGVWAPCLTYADGLFWLMYSDVKRYGRTTVGGVESLDLQRNSRIGATFSKALTRHHAIRASVSRGAYTTVGADFTSIAVGYNYAWARQAP